MTPTHDTSSQFSDELGIYAEDQSMTSIVSYPKRCNQWGSPTLSRKLRWSALQESGSSVQG